MARPRIYKENRVVTPVRLTVSVRHDLQRLARARRVSVNLLITQAVEEFLTRSRGPVSETESFSTSKTLEQSA